MDENRFKGSAQAISNGACPRPTLARIESAVPEAAHLIVNVCCTVAKIAPFALDTRIRLFPDGASWIASAQDVPPGPRLARC